MVCVPVGYMPAQAADGSFILRICGGVKPARSEQGASHGMHDIGHTAAHDDHAGHAAHDDEAHEMRCDYAGATVIDVPPAPIMVANIPAPEGPGRDARTPLSGIFPPRLPPATGPPSA